MKKSNFSWLGMAFAVLAQPAFSVEAMRCNVQVSPGHYAPVLRVVAQGHSRDIQLGAEGLSRKVFYRDRRVIAYLSSVLGVPRSQLPRSVSRTCGAVEEASERTASAAAAAPPAPAPSPAGREEVTESVEPGDYPATDVAR